ncbi:MAG: hypothetical protein APF76_18310 [Desulfitibacter sp. BRH_c19]|nr:MAG: hypothetical protein APF76_18310 [Desulfitibacter sp. BRH_c19]
MKKCLIIFLILLLSLTLVACGGSSKDAASGEYAMNDSAAPMESRDYDQSSAEEDGQNPVGDLDQRKIIKNAELTIEVEFLGDVVREIEKQIGSSGGFLEESNINQNGSSYLWAEMVLRMPASEFEEFVVYLEEIGTVKNRRVYRDDVTTRFIDLEARLKVLKAEEESILSILQKAESVEDVLNIRKELRTLRSEIEVLEGELKYLTNMVSYSTIRVHIQQAKVSETRIDATGIAGVWQKGINALTKNVNGIISLVGNMFVFVIGSIPILIPLGVAAVGIWHVKKRRKKDQSSL